MPDIPRYEAKSNIQGGPIAPQEDLAMQDAANQNNVLGTITKIAQSWSDAHDVMQETEVQDVYGRKEIEAQKLATEEGDYKNPEKYYELIKQARTDALEGVDNQQLAQRLEFDLAQKSQLANIKIDSILKKKRIEVGQRSLYSKVSTDRDVYANEVNPNKRTTIKEETIKDIMKNAATGVISPEKEASLLKNIEDTWDRDRITLDISRDMSIRLEDSYVYNELKKGDEGDYGDADNTVRMSLIDDIQRKVKLNQEVFRDYRSKEQDNNEKNVLLDLIENKGTGTTTSGSLKDASLAGDIRSDFGTAVSGQLYKNFSTETNPVDYNNIVQMQITGENRSKINKRLASSLSSLEENDARVLVEGFEDYSEEDKVRVRYGADALKQWTISSLGDLPYIYEHAMYDFYKKVRQGNHTGDKIDETAKQIQKQVIKNLYSKTALLEDTPNFIATQNKVRKVYEKEAKNKNKGDKTKRVRSSSEGTVLSFDDL